MLYQEHLYVEPKVADPILMAAADIIESFGWCQGGFGDLERGPVCTLGALLIAANVNPLNYKNHPSAKSMERLRKHLKVKNIAEWNDAVGRTKAEVLTALRSA